MHQNFINIKNLNSMCNVSLSTTAWSRTGWYTKMSLFFFSLYFNFYKNKETFNIFSPQILEVYRILLVWTTLESIMIYYTFSVINTMFVPCTALLYGSTATTRTIKLSTTLLSISCAICLIPSLMMSCLVCGLFSQILSFRYPLRQVEILGIGWPVLSVWPEMSLSHGALCLNLNLIKISTCLTIFWGATWKTEFVKTIHRQERTSSEKESDRLHKKCSMELWKMLLFELLLIQQRSPWNEHSTNYWKNIVKHYWL